MRIGVLSDTHNYLDPKVLILFRDVKAILHAGDIGQPWILLELEQIAPVHAVAGNTDDDFGYPLTELVQLEDIKFLIHHIYDVRMPDEGIRRRIERERPNVVLFGHTHKPYESTQDGILYFNPGYAGKPRFNQPRSVAILSLEAGGIRSQFLPL